LQRSDGIGDSMLGARRADFESLIINDDSGFSCGHFLSQF
jgi:hypothetical protein